MNVVKLDSELVDGKYVPPLPLKSKVTCIRAPTGSGKTVAVSRYVWDAAQDHKRILFVVPRRSLADLALRAFPFLADYRKSGRSKISGSAVVCCDSLYRLADPAAYDLVVFDEYQQIRRQTFGGHIKSAEIQDRNLSMRHELLRFARRSVVCDALLSTDDIRDISGAVSDPDQIELRTLEHPATRWAISTSPSEVMALVSLRASLGKRMAVFMAASHTKVIATARTIGELSGNPAKVLAITAESVESADGTRVPVPHGQEWASWDHVVYSPALGSGVSIDVRDHFDHVVGLVWNKTVTAEEVYQGLRRVRHPKDQTFTCFVQAGGDSGPASMGGISRAIAVNSRQALTRASSNASASELVSREAGLWWSPENTPAASPHRLRVMRDLRASGALGGDLHKALLVLIESRLSGVVVDLPREELHTALGQSSGLRKIAAQHRANVEDRRVAEIMSARDIRPGEASTASDAEKHRWMVIQTYGECSEPIVRHHLSGGLLKTENWGNMWADVHGYRAALIAEDAKDVLGGRLSLDPRLRRVETVEAFRAVFDRIPGFVQWFSRARDGDLTVPHDVIESVMSEAMTSPEVRRRLQERRIYTGSPKRSFGLLLRSLGLKTALAKARRSRRADGTPCVVRDSIISADSADFMSGVSRLYREQLLEGVTPCLPSESDRASLSQEVQPVPAQPRKAKKPSRYELSEDRAHEVAPVVSSPVVVGKAVVATPVMAPVRVSAVPRQTAKPPQTSPSDAVKTAKSAPPPQESSRDRAHAARADLERMADERAAAVSAIKQKRDGYTSEARRALIEGEATFTHHDVKDEWTRLIRLHFPDWVPGKPGASAVLPNETGHARNIAKGYTAERAFAAMERFFERLPDLVKQSRRLRPGDPPEFKVFASEYVAIMDREVTTGISLKDAAKKDAPGWIREKPKLLGSRDNDGPQRNDESVRRDVW